MIQPASLALGLGLGAVLSLLIRVLAAHVPSRHRLLPPSVAAAGPELVTAMSLAIAEQYPDLKRLDYAAVSVFERNSPENTVHFFPARGPSLGFIRLDPSDPSSPGGRAARLLAEMNLGHGVMVIPFGSR
ncbi:hypothetical protein OG592_43475 (plasmid) [Streptomyces avidinii]|uniref:hypothetical protein n=1 Tax=Streptomyces avidinii TaxID=1895 RepID=UPI002F910282|nr:hypothetical protein OG592_43475 [Streptomyces avidinii]